MVVLYFVSVLYLHSVFFVVYCLLLGFFNLIILAIYYNLVFLDLFDYLLIALFVVICIYNFAYYCKY